MLFQCKRQKYTMVVAYNNIHAEPDALSVHETKYTMVEELFIAPFILLSALHYCLSTSI